MMEVWAAIGAVSGAAGALLTLVGLVAAMWWKITSHLREQDREAAVQAEKISRIEHEVFANSGESMRDRIEDTAKSVEKIKGYLEAKREGA